MTDFDTVPRSRSLSPNVAPIPANISSRPVCMTDPLLSLTPEKHAKPIHNARQSTHNAKPTTHNSKPTTHNAKPTTHNAKPTSHNVKLGCVRVERHEGATNEESIATRTNCTATQGLIDKRTGISPKHNLAPRQVASQVSSGQPKNSVKRAVPHKKKNNSRNNRQFNAKIQQKGAGLEKTHNALAHPQCHSSAAVSRHLERLQKEKFNGENAVLSTLQQSQTARIAFAEKVAEGVNRPLEERKYAGLISVDAPVDDTIAQSERIMSKVRHAPGGKKISEGPVPDILDLFTPDMIVEQPSFDLSSLSLDEDVKLEQAPPEMAFNLYKHMRCWESS